MTVLTSIRSTQTSRLFRILTEIGPAQLRSTTLYTTYSPDYALLHFRCCNLYDVLLMQRISNLWKPVKNNIQIFSSLRKITNSGMTFCSISIILLELKRVGRFPIVHFSLFSWLLNRNRSLYLLFPPQDWVSDSF